MIKYKTILVDPPWPVKFSARKQRPNQVNWPYQIMTVEEIAKLPISDLADQRSNLFLWTTQTFLHDALHLIELWDFVYHVCITWDKKSGLTFYGFHRRTEFLLYGYKGINRDDFCKTGQSFPTLITSSAGKHSRKPAVMYDLIEAHMPEPRVELFARPFSPMYPKRPNWHVWGNEIDSDIDLGGL